MIDTHSHIYYPEFREDSNALVDRCIETGVTHVILPNVNAESLGDVKEFHYNYPDFTSMAIGIHPTEVKEDWRDFVEKMEAELKTGQYVAVGEIGIDLYWDKSNLKVQQEAFEAQLNLAQKFSLPVIIHSREAFEETMQVIEKVKPFVTLIFHSFTGNKANVDRIRKGCDPYFGINGVVTYKNAPLLRDALLEIGIDKIVLETDAPYLSPVPYRGKRNDSSLLSFIRDKISEVLQISPEEVESITDKNACKIFKIPNNHNSDQI